MWTQCQKCGQNHTKVDKILVNDTFGLSKLGIGCTIASMTIVSIFLTFTAHNRACHKSIIDSSCLVPLMTLLRYWTSYL